MARLRVFLLLVCAITTGCGGDAGPPDAGAEPDASHGEDAGRDGGEPSHAPVVSAQILSGAWQTGPVAEPLSAPLVARLLDAQGRPVAGERAEFVIVSGGGSLETPAVASDLQGLVRTRWTLGTSISVEATVELRLGGDGGAALALATFTAVALSGPPVSFRGAPEYAGPAGGLARASVSLEDAYRNAVTGTVLQWSGAGAEPTSATSLASRGLASMTYRLPTSTAAVVAGQVSAGTFSHTFRLRVLPAAPAAFLGHDTSPTFGLPGGVPARPVDFTVIDAYGNLAAGSKVTLAITGGGGSFEGTTRKTLDATLDGNGRLLAPGGTYASQRWRLGPALGETNTLAATLPGGEALTFTAEARDPYLAVLSHRFVTSAGAPALQLLIDLCRVDRSQPATMQYGARAPAVLIDPVDPIYGPPCRRWVEVALGSDGPPYTVTFTATSNGRVATVTETITEPPPSSPAG